MKGYQKYTDDALGTSGCWSIRLTNPRLTPRLGVSLTCWFCRRAVSSYIRGPMLIDTAMTSFWEGPFSGLERSDLPSSNPSICCLTRSCDWALGIHVRDNTSPLEAILNGLESVFLGSLLVVKQSPPQHSHVLALLSRCVSRLCPIASAIFLGAR